MRQRMRGAKRVCPKRKTKKQGVLEKRKVGKTVSMALL